LWSHEVCKADMATNVGDEIFLLSVGLVNINYTRWLQFWLCLPQIKHGYILLHCVHRNYEIFTFWLATNLAV